MFRFLVPRQHGNVLTTTSLLCQVFKDRHTSEPLKFAVGAGNSYRFIETGKGLPGGTIRQMGGGLGKMATKNEEEYFYKKTKSELNEIKKKIQTEAITPPVKRKLEQEALKLDLKLKQMNVRSVVDRAQEAKSNTAEDQADKLSKQQEPLEQKPKLEHKAELKESQSLKRLIQPMIPKPEKPEVNKIHYAEHGRSPIMQPTNHLVNKVQQEIEMQQLQSRPGTQPPQPKTRSTTENQHSLRKRLKRGQEELKTIKEDLKEIHDKVNLVDTLKSVPKENADYVHKKVKPHMRRIDSKKLWNQKRSGMGMERSPELQKAIREAEKAYKDTQKKEK